MLEETLAEILEEAATKSGDGPSVELLEDTWPTLVGRELSRLTHPAGYSNGVLHITVASADWKRELEHRRATLLRRVNGVLPWRVTAIDFDVGQVPDPPEREDTGREERPVSSEPVDEATEAALEHVDPSLKSTLRKIRHHMLRERDQ